MPSEAKTHNRRVAITTGGGQVEASKNGTAPKPSSQGFALGGIGDLVARQLKELVAQDTRTVVLGHLLRGGSPTALDRQLGLSFGVAAIHALSDGRTNVMVAFATPTNLLGPVR
jgi:6-phosphofructokinase 1